MEMGELKSCPFCGAEAFTSITVMRGTTVDKIKYGVRCYECSIQMSESIVNGANIDELMTVVYRVNARWNKRIPSTVVTKEEEYDISRSH